MKGTGKQRDEVQIRREYPIADRTPGWFFRVFEQSMCVWRAEGTDLRGRKVSDVGTDENCVLDSCIAMATEINRQLASKPV